MKTLLLETSTEKSFLAIVQDKIAISKHLVGGPLLSKHLALEVATLLEKTIPGRIGVGMGPGSLTGVRVGLSLARSLAFGWKIPYFEFCSLKTFVPEELGPFAVLVDARSQGIHYILGEKREAGIRWGNPLLLAPEALVEVLAQIPIIISPHPHLVEPRIHRPCQMAEPSHTQIV